MYKYVRSKIVKKDDRKEIYKENKKLLTLSVATLGSRRWFYKKSPFNEITIKKLYLREQEYTRSIYEKNIPEEFKAIIYQLLREKNKKRKENF